MFFTPFTEYMFGSGWIFLRLAFCVFFFSFFFFWCTRFSFLETKCTVYVLFMHCLRIVHGTHNYYIQGKKNGSHRTIHTFKNYFATVFLVFSKISCIQTDSKWIFFFFFMLIMLNSELWRRKVRTKFASSCKMINGLRWDCFAQLNNNIWWAVGILI